MWLGCLRPLGTSSLVRSDTVRLDAFALPPGVLYFVGRGMRLFQDARRTTHRVAIVVYDSTAPAGTGKGVYMEARAESQTTMCIAFTERSAEGEEREAGEL